MKYIFLLVKKMSRRNLYKFFMESLVEIKSIENLRVLNIGAGGPIQGFIEFRFSGVWIELFFFINKIKSIIFFW